MSPRRGRRPAPADSKEIVYRRTDQQGPLRRVIVKVPRDQGLSDLSARGAVALATGINADSIKIVEIKAA